MSCNNSFKLILLLSWHQKNWTGNYEHALLNLYVLLAYISDWWYENSLYLIIILYEISFVIYFFKIDQSCHLNFNYEDKYFLFIGWFEYNFEFMCMWRFNSFYVQDDRFIVS